MKIGSLEVYGIIYKIQNLVNGKVYIGQTINERGFDGRYKVENWWEKTHNEHLKNAVYKYGFDNFSINKILDIAFSQDELNIKEICWIDIYDSNNREKGYNMKSGGCNGKPNEEALINYSIAQLGFDIRNYKDYIIDKYSKNVTANEIAKSLNTSSYTILNYLRKWEVDIRTHSEELLGYNIEKYQDDIINKYKEYSCLERIANIYDVSANVIKRILIQNNIEIEDRYITKIGLDIDKYKTEIIKLYNDKKKNTYEIAEIYDLDETTLWRRLIQWGVKIRTLSEVKLGFNINDYADDIVFKYESENMYINEISSIYKVNDCVIRRILVENNVPILTDSERMLGFNIELEKDKIISMYTSENMSCRAIAKEYGVSQSTISKYLDMWIISKKTMSEIKMGQNVGYKNPASTTIKVYDIGWNLLKVFNTKKECGQWLVNNKISNKLNTAMDAISDCVKKNRPYKKKYYFESIKNYNFNENQAI